MANYNLNYLLKDELSYELITRGQEITLDNVEALRKQLRKCLHIVPDVRNLNGKISLLTELESIQTKLTSLDLLLEQCSENVSNLQVAKINAKLNHLQLRISNLGKCKLDDTYRPMFDELTDKFPTYKAKFDTLKSKISEEELTSFEEKLNQSLIEEEEENTKLERRVSTPTACTSTPIQTKVSEHVLPPLQLQTLNVVPMQNQELQNQNLLQANVTLFNKLSNPIEKYLSKFSTCNGLDVNELLKFLNNLTELRNLTPLTQTEIYEILPIYTAPPLLNKILECKSQQLTLNDLHQKIISAFIPITLKEKLKQDLIFRPQKPHEPLAIYINEVKNNNQILQTNLTETELVAFIKNGIHPEIRNKLVFESNPVTFEDLDRLCINLNNVNYNDYIRNKLYPQPSASMHNTAFSSKPKPRYSSGMEEKVCYNCNRKGHLARQCYRTTNQKN